MKMKIRNKVIKLVGGLLLATLCFVVLPNEAKAAWSDVNAVGDVNADSCFDVRDLVHLSKNVSTPTSIKDVDMADFDANKKISAVDIEKCKQLLVGSATKANDFEQGISFEHASEASVFYTPEDANWHTVKTLTRVKYADYGIKGGSGNYGMRGEKKSDASAYPRFHINFGTEIPADSVLTFKVYIPSQDNTNQYSITCTDLTEKVFKYSEGKIYQANKWVEVSYRFTVAASDLVVYATTDSLSDKGTSIFIDDFKLSSMQSVNFDTNADIAWFDRTGGAFSELRMDSIQIVDCTNISDGKTNYALKGTKCTMYNRENDYSGVVLRFGKTMPKGSKLTFKAYLDNSDGTRYALAVRKAVSGGGEKDVAARTGDPNTWIELSATLDEDISHVYIRFYFEGSKNSNITMYLDDFSLVTPSSWESGFGFENCNDMEYFSHNLASYGHNMKSLSVVEYATEGLPKTLGSGSHVLKGETPTNYPRFYIDFKETVPAGSKLKFKIYIPSDDNTTVAIASKDINDTNSNTPSPNAIPTNTWTDITLTLNHAQQQLYIYCYIGGLTDKPTAIYMDNFELSNWSLGMDFENEGDMAYFSHDLDSDDNNMTSMELVNYASVGLQKEAGSGDYVLKGNVNAKAGYNYPRFYIDFGQQVAGGSQLKFRVYIPSDDTTNIVTLSSKNIDGTVNYNTPVPNPTNIPTNTWTEITLNLNNPQQQLYIYFNVGSLSDKPEAIYMDSFELVIKETPKTGWDAGIGFESADDMQYFSYNLASNDNNMTSLEVVDYTSAGIPKEAGSGDYVLKGNVLAKQYYDYPRFYIDFKESVPAGSKLKFRVYVPSDDSENKVTAIASAAIEGGATNKPSISELSTNTWTEVTIDLGTNGNTQQKLYVYFFIRALTDRPEAIYMDNFELIINE